MQLLPVPQKRKQPERPPPEASQPSQQRQHRRDKKKKKRRVTTSRLHSLTSASATGAGEAAAAAVGRRAKESELGVVRARGAVPAWAPLPALGVVPRAADVAASLEALRAEKLDQLRAVLRKQCEENGLVAPPQLAFERWRFGCAMQAEQQPGGGSADEAVRPVEKQAGKKKKKKRSGRGAEEEPLVPSGVGDGGGLVSDLLRAGLSQEQASDIARGLDAASAAASAAVQAEAAKFDRGVAVPTTRVPTIEFHRHSIDLRLGKCFVKLNREAYGKLCELHRRHAPVNERLPPLALSLPDGQHEDDGAEANVAAIEHSRPDKDGSGPRKRAAVHARIFALLQRYKALHGAGFHAACPPAVFEILRERLGVQFEAFASPLNCYFPRHCSVRLHSVVRNQFSSDWLHQLQ